MIAAFGGEREFAGFGAEPNMSVLPGVCHPTAPKPSANVRRLQKALQGLAQRVGDAKASPGAGAKGADGLVGPKTVGAVNYAVPRYTSAPDVLSTGRLTHAQVVSFSPQLAAFVEKAPQKTSAQAGNELLTPAFMTTQASPMPAAPPAVLPSAAASAYTASTGGRPMPAPAQYYPPGYAPAPAYPGYAPAPQRQASVDIRAFIPAQYEHVKFNPLTVAALAGAVVVTVMVMQRRGEKK